MQKEEKTVDVPGQIFKKFLDDLKIGEIPEEIIGRLTVTLLQQRNLAEAKIRTSIFPN